MKKKERDILQDLLKLYTDMYPSKELFNKAYFKYAPEEMAKIIDDFLTIKEVTPQQGRNVVRESIQSIQTVEEVGKFYLENLQFDSSDEKSKEECLKSISLNELKHLYNILFSSPIRANIRKNELLELIRNYFESIDRALSMKP